MMLMPPAVLPEDPEEAFNTFSRLWVHETYRVFYDRLVDDKDRTWLLKHVKDACSTHIGRDFNDLMANLSPGGGAVSNESMRKCFFGDYMDTEMEPAERRYAEVNDVS